MLRHGGARNNWRAGWLLLLALGGIGDQVAMAQVRTFPASMTREERQQQLDDTNNFLLDSEREWEDTNRRGRLVPQLAPVAKPTTEMLQLRPLLKELSDEAQRFAYDINEDARRSPGLKTLMPTVLKLRTQAQLLTQRGAEENNHLVMLEDMQAVDTGWRDLMFSLQRSRDLSQNTKESIATLQDIAKDIELIIKINPQYDQKVVLMKTATMARDFENLLEDIELELGRSADSQQFLIAGGKVQQQVLLLASLLQDTAERDSVVDEYRRFQNLWYPQAAKLQKVDNMQIERSLRRITNADSELHSLLQLPSKLDKQQLIYLAAVLRNDIDTFFERTPLSLLVHLPNAESALATADQFYGVCENFIDQVTRDEDYDQLVDSFRYIEAAERDFTAIYRNIPSKAALSVLRQVEQTLDTLRLALQVQREDFDRRAAAELAASIENLADQLDFTTKRWLSRERAPFATDCLRDTADLLREATQLHKDLVAGSSMSNYRSQVDQLYSRWRRVYGYLVKCQTEDRSQLGRLSSKLTPSLIDLRTMISQQ